MKSKYPSRLIVPTARGLVALATILLAWGGTFASQAQVYGAIDLWPRNSTVEIGGTKSFGAYVPITPNNVEWLVNGIPGGDVTLGTISASGLYRAPSAAPMNSVLTITARSTAFPATTASTSLTVTRPYPWLWSISPSSLQTGSFSISLNGNNFAADSVVTANGMDLPTTYVSKTRLTATGMASSAGTIAFAVRHPGPGAVKGNSVNAAVQAASVTVSVSPGSATVLLGQTQSFAATVTGSANTAVVWSVVGGSVNGVIDALGNYMAPALLPSPAQLKVRASSAAHPSAYGEATVQLVAPPSALPSLAVARYLEQSSFGPHDTSIAQVQSLGIPGHLDWQFSLPASTIPTPSGNSVGALQQWILHHYTAAPDQLRQRVIYALSQILVVSANKQVYADAMLPWMRALSLHAFGNYKDLLRDVTRSSSMGKYLDLANSTKPGIGGGANENFARELLQLFTIGLWKLKPDGTQDLGPGGSPVSTYTQEDVAQLSLALTGWTYATPPGGIAFSQNHEYHGAPMETRPALHATGSKTVLGEVIPAGQTVEQDLESVLTLLMNHPNTAPFISLRLIRSLVASNPSGAYVTRVAQVFQNTGGNLREVVRAILLDEEARPESPPSDFGRLKEPLLQVSGFLRALNGQFNPHQQLTYLFAYMAQSPLNPPSVFSWFSPLHRVPRSPLFGPEFQIYTPTESVLRGNLFHYILNSGAGDFSIDLSPYQPFGNDMPGLVELANQRLLRERMPAGMKQVLIDAATPGYDARTRIETVLYLTALSGQFAVQY